jgi:hypothetical protein
MLTIQRDASATKAALTVSYAWSGTAVQGVDYAASPTGTSVTLPAGVAKTNITITPLFNPAGSPGRTVSLTLLPGEYVVGTPASNSVALGAYTTPASTFSSATGGTVTNYTDAGGTNWTAHTFEKSGTFSVTGCGPVDVLVVAGGGGGGYFMGGGGGGGGVIYSSSFWVFDGEYSIGIGGGGSGGASLTGTGGQGGNSFFANTALGGSMLSLTAIGGGGGGSSIGSYLAPTSGGSGGGGSIGETGYLDAINGAAGTPPHGYAGGNGLLTAQNAGGGGGAGGIGVSGSATTGGAGGVGRVVDITGSSVCYGGGGGGGAGDGRSYGPGGLGGGGNGSVPDGQDGTSSRGGGGGGASGSRLKNGGNGGSGIVIVRYRSTRPTSSKPAATNNPAPANVTAFPASRAASVKPSESEIQAAQRLQGAFVWTQADPPAAQTYAAFRKTFESDKALSSATLRIFGDTRYLLWINGHYVSRGPCRFDPKRPEYDVLDVAKYVRRGRNVMVVLSHYYSKGDGSEYNDNARLMQHRPGLTAELELTQPDGSATRLKTDASWRCTTQTRHLPGPTSYGSVYDRIDARLDSGDWTGIDFDDSSWPAAVPLAANGWEPLHVRSIPLLREVEVDNLSLVKVKNMSVELGPLTNRLPLVMAAGAQVVIDCGRAVQGYTVLDFEASAGSQLEVDYRVLEKDKGSEWAVGGPNRYTARAGRQTYMSTDTYGCKPIVLTVTSGDITLRGFRVVDRLYPFERLGRFVSNDKGVRGLDRIWQIGVRTVELCSEDAIVDCAERERGQWIADGFMMGYPVSRVALAGPGKDGQPYYADGRLLKNMLRHLAFGQMPDGRIRPLRPCEYPVERKHGVIDDYSCIWVHAVAEYYRRDADLEFVREVWPVMVKQLDYFLKRRTDRGLVYANEFFYFGNPLAYVTCEGATINAYIYRSLRDAAELGLAAGDTQNAARFAGAADQLREAYNRELWDDETGAYHAAIVRTPVPPVAPDSPPSYSQGYHGPKDTNGLTPPTGHAAAIALYYDLVPAERQARVLAYMQKQFESIFPYTFRFYLENLYRQDTDEMDRNALKTIREKWQPMALGETGTTWERVNNGVFLHESGAHPAYLLSSYVLGVRTEGPRDARQLLIDPRLGDLTSAEGTTLTEFGPVSVHWERDADLSLSFEIVNGTTVPAMLSLRLPANTSVMIDGKAVLGADLGLKDGRMHFSLSPGRHGGRVNRSDGLRDPQSTED